MKKVIFVAGPPGAGKTQFIKQYHFNKYKVFDLDNYRKKNKNFSVNNPLSYSENTTKKAGLMMKNDINKSLVNDSTIVIETTFSSLNNTLEHIKNNDNYQIYVYLFMINELEFFISILERYINCYTNGDICRLISFEKYLRKIKFYKEYINVIKNYNISISYVVRNGNILKIFDNYSVVNNEYNIKCYSGRIGKIKEFCSQKKVSELTKELNNMLHYYDNYAIALKKHK